MRRPMPPLAPVTRATRPRNALTALVAEPLEALLVGLALRVALGLALFLALLLAAIRGVLVDDPDAGLQRAVAAEAPEVVRPATPSRGPASSR